MSKKQDKAMRLFRQEEINNCGCICHIEYLDVLHHHPCCAFMYYKIKKNNGNI